MAGTAEAKKAIDVGIQKTRTVTASGNQGIMSATANCPANTRALSGGFAFGGGFASLRGIPYESHKVGQRAWIVSTQIEDPAPPAPGLTQTTFVVCQRGVAKTSQASSTIALPDANAAGLGTTATCPAGKKAMAGGFATPPPVLPSGNSQTIITDSLRVGKTGWRTGALKELSGTGPSTLTSYVYCATTKKPPSARVAVGPPVAAGQFSEVSVRCPKGLFVKASGFSQSGVSAPPATGVLTPHLSDFADSARVWTVRAERLGTSTTPTTLSTIAYCA